MSDKYLVIDSENKVLNIILWDGISEYNPGEGLSVELAPDFTQTFYDIGTYKQEDGTFLYKYLDGTFHSNKESFSE